MKTFVPQCFHYYFKMMIVFNISGGCVGGFSVNCSSLLEKKKYTSVDQVKEREVEWSESNLACKGQNTEPA